MKNITMLFVFATLGSLFVAYKITADNKEIESANIPLWNYSDADIGLQEKEPSKAPDTAPVEYVMIHPLFKAYYMCGEHWEGQLAFLGDNLGSDCIVTGGLPANGKSGFSKPYRTDGKTNEDWYGWLEPVLAPFDGVVARININTVVNKPGELGKPPASFVVFKYNDGTMVLFAHVTEITVKEGEKVVAGQPFAKVGNNGFGRNPHIHVGAWRGETPLQIRFDLRAAARLHNKQPG